jgi:hypothetical protein
MLKALLLLAAVLVAGAAWAMHSKRHKPSPPPSDEALSVEKAIQRLSDSPVIEEVESPRPELFRLAVVRGEDALAAIPILDALEKKHHWRAIFIGTKDDLPDFDASDIQEPAAILAAAEAIDAEDFLSKRLDELTEGNPDEPELQGEWPQDAHPESVLPEKYSVFTEVLTGKFHAHVHIALIPTDEAWKAPAYLQNGNWNEVPSPAEQVSVLRYWHQKYGARLRTFSNDVMELEATRHPRDREQALTLAKQQFGFCSDIVWQGVGSLRPLAAALERADHWYFWWD